MEKLGVCCIIEEESTEDNTEVMEDIILFLKT